MNKLIPIVCAALVLAGCSTTQQATVATDTQKIATVLRQAEGWFPKPDSFNLYFDLVTKGNAKATEHADAIKAKYADLYAKGELTVQAVELLASQYDTK